MCATAKMQPKYKQQQRQLKPGPVQFRSSDEFQRYRHHRVDIFGSQDMLIELFGRADIAVPDNSKMIRLNLQ